MAKQATTPENLTPFSKGVSGNPAGRPLGSKNRSTILKHWIETSAEVENPETGEIVKGTIEDKIALAVIKRALTGDISAYKEIADSVYGKATQVSEVNQVNTNYNIDISKEEADNIINALNDKI